MSLLLLFDQFNVSMNKRSLKHLSDRKLLNGSVYLLKSSPWKIHTIKIQISLKQSKEQTLKCTQCLSNNADFWPERRDLSSRIFLRHLHRVIGEAGLQVLDGQEGVVEVQGGNLIWHLWVMGTTGVSITQNDVVKPVGNHTLCVHEVTNGLKHSLQAKKRNKELFFDNCGWLNHYFRCYSISNI